MPPERPARTELDRIHDSIETVNISIQELRTDIATILATCGGCQKRIDKIETDVANNSEKISIRSVGWLIGIIGTLIGTIGGAIAMAVGRGTPPSIP